MRKSEYMNSVVINEYPMKKLVPLLIMSFLLPACNGKRLKEPLPAKVNQNLKYFGYTLVDVGWDDPTDKETRTNYLDEVQGFSNVADILVVNPTDNIVSRVMAFDQNGVQAILHLNEVFFEQKGTGGDKSGIIYGLRTDYQKRWDTFIATNDLATHTPLINCLYIGEEPAWNGISENEFQQACDYAKSTLPQVPILSVEAYTNIENMYAPESVDWVGFDHYFLQRPSEDADYQREFKTLNSRKKSHQKIFLIMDTHWIQHLHGYFGIDKEELDVVARDYYNIANADPSIIGILGYFWPNGFDSETAIGARGLPRNVQDEHKQIGKAITGK